MEDGLTGAIMTARRGFTLVEMLVVLTILVMVAAIAIPAAGALTANYGLAGDQARFMSTLSQARALAIRHNICYSVVFNNIDPDSNWYTIIQHRTDIETESTDNQWSIKGQLAILNANPLNPTKLDDLDDAKEMASNFLVNQIGPRRQMQPGVRIGVFRPDPAGVRVSGKKSVAEPYWCTVKRLSGDWDVASYSEFNEFDEFMRNGIAMGVIQFAPTGGVARVVWGKSATLPNKLVAEDLTLTMESGDTVALINGRENGADERRGSGTTSNPNYVDLTNPFLATGSGTTLNYIVIGLSTGDRERVVRDDGNMNGQGVYWGSSGRHIGIGINKVTGAIVAKSRWAPEE